MKKYQAFKRTICSDVLGSELKQQIPYRDSIITETVDGYIFVDGQITEYATLEEALEQLKQEHLQETVQKKLQQDLYGEMSDNKVADIIRRYHSDIKITDTLIESYVELSSSKIFTLDPVAHDITKFNKLDCIVEGRLDYKLEDGSSVVISEQTYQQLNNIFGKHPEIVSYIRTSADNFLDVINQLGE